MSDSIGSVVDVLRVEDLAKHYRVRSTFFSRARNVVKALDGVSLRIGRGEILGLVGESGCGKTTLARCILRIDRPTQGKVVFNGREISHLSRPELKSVRRNMQIVFQDPYGSLTPRMRIKQLLREPLDVHRIGNAAERADLVTQMLELVGLSADHGARFPHELSGGQRQRIAIARAIMVKPQLIIADEPVSALDVSVRAQIINLMVRLQREFHLSYLFISHDLGVIKYLTDRIVVMYLGRIVEVAPRDALYAEPHHPYTISLMAAIPVPRVGGRSKSLAVKGEIPSPTNPPTGCPYHPRCFKRQDRCVSERPALVGAGGSRMVACHYPEGIRA